MNKKKWLELLKLIVPVIVATTVPTAGPVLAGLIVHGIEIAEESGKPGSVKLTIAKEEIKTVAAGVNAVKPGTVNVDQLGNVVDQIISASVNTANLVKNIPVQPQ